jgi:hypothetical protein
MRMNSVAEGVETVEQAALLQSLGCTAAQGFLWSPAVPPAELIAVLGALPEGRFDVPSPSDGSPRSTRAAHDGVTDEHGSQRLMRLHRDGASLTTIAAALNTEGHRTPGGLRWHRASRRQSDQQSRIPRPLVGAAAVAREDGPAAHSRRGLRRLLRRASQWAGLRPPDTGAGARRHARHHPQPRRPDLRTRGGPSLP